MASSRFSIFTDGGAIDNPGPAAVGVVIKDGKGKVLTYFGKFVGKTTNNVTNYRFLYPLLK